MNLGHLMRVVWARRLVVLVAALSCFLGGVVMILTTDKRYEASTRVQLDLIKPDPITGFHINSKNSDVYVASQIQAIKDFQVAGRAAEDLGWLDSPELQAAYAQLPPGTNQKFDHWVAQRIVAGTAVRPVEDSNILEIRFRADSPQMARRVAQAIREAYVNDMSDTQAAIAEKSLPAYRAQSEKARIRLSELENRRAQMEHETGVILQDNGVDLDSSRLRQLAVTVPKMIDLSGLETPVDRASVNLAQTDAAIEQATRVFGPNNPQLQALKQKRTLLATQVAQQARDRTSVVDSSRMRSKQTDNEITTQTAKVIAQSSKVTQLRLLQDEINKEQERYNSASARAGEAVQRMAGGGGNVTPVGLTDGPDKAVYPNDPLILGGTGALGIAAGVLLAFLTELFERRVRTEADLQPIMPGIRIAVVPTLRSPRWRRRRMVSPRRPSLVVFKRKAARA